jgi:hypothetical protein
LLKEHQRADELEDTLKVYNKKSIWKIWTHRAGDFPQLTGQIEEKK